MLVAGFIGLVGSYLLTAKFDVTKGKTASDFDAGYVQICEDQGDEASAIVLLLYM